jgi:hypothetical protein
MRAAADISAAAAPATPVAADMEVVAAADMEAEEEVGATAIDKNTKARGS